MRRCLGTESLRLARRAISASCRLVDPNQRRGTACAGGRLIGCAPQDASRAGRGGSWWPVANEALGAVKDSAQAHGLTTDKPIGDVVADLKSGSLVDSVKQVASETVDAGKQSAQKHFPSGESDVPVGGTN